MTDDPSPTLDPDKVNRLQRMALAVQIDHTTLEVVEAFALADVASVVLKGPAIATWLYEYSAERFYEDVDLLVPPDRLDIARRVLDRLGFSNQLVQTSEHERAAHDEPWKRDAVLVELHRTLSGATARPEIVWGTLSKEIEHVQLDGSPIPILSLPARCVVVVLHAAHHGEDVTSPLEDLQRALERVPSPVWRTAASLAARIGATQAFAAGLRLDPKGSTIALTLELPLVLSVDAALHANSVPPMALALEWLAHGPLTCRQKVVFAARKLVPPHAFLRAAYPLARRGRLGLAAAYGVRIGALVRRLPAGVRALRQARRDTRST